MLSLRFVLAGAAIGNGNRGIEALGQSVIDAAGRWDSRISLGILDDGWGVRKGVDHRYDQLDLDYVGVRHSRRWHRPESWAQIRIAQTLAPRANAVARRFAAADAVLDISGGDSFTDLYGAARLDKICAPKLAALRAGRPLVLLPQTYGPFRTNAGRRDAERLIRSAALAYARDARSFERLAELAGPNADLTRLRQGVDLAFALDPQKPTPEVVERMESLGGGPIVGVNASGLLRGDAGRTQFGLASDYIGTLVELVRGLLERGVHVVFVPHVHVPDGGSESDVVAINQIRDRLSTAARARTTVLPPDLSAAEVKWCISQLDWFVGSRMHSTIAALSTLTPVTAFAYSDKNLGVFQTCGVGDQVVDARSTGGREAAQEILAQYEQRDTLRSALAAHAPAVIAASRRQLADLFHTVAGWAQRPSPVETIA